MSEISGTTRLVMGAVTCVVVAIGFNAADSAASAESADSASPSVSHQENNKYEHAPYFNGDDEYWSSVCDLYGEDTPESRQLMAESLEAFGLDPQEYEESVRSQIDVICVNH